MSKQACPRHPATSRRRGTPPPPAARVAALAAAGRHPRRAVPLDIPPGGAHRRADHPDLLAVPHPTWPSAHGEDGHHRPVRRHEQRDADQRDQLHRGHPAAGRPSPCWTQLQTEGRARPPASTSSPGFGTELLNWIIILAPFIILVWFWRRLSRGAAGQMQGILGVGRSRAKVFDEERPSTTFADVAGYDGAKSEISEVVDFLRNPDRYARGRGRGPARRAHGRPAGNRQDAARARRGGRGAGALLLGHRLQLRGDVRRRRRGPRPRPVRRGAQAVARDHLHRRDRRDRPAPGGLGRGRLQRRAGADAQPAARRDGRLRPHHGHRGPRRDQPARGPRPRPAAPRPVRPAGDDPAAQRQRARGDPAGPHQGQEARAQRGPRAWSPGAPPASPVRTWRTSRTRRPSSRCATTGTW